MHKRNKNVRYAKPCVEIENTLSRRLFKMLRRRDEIEVKVRRATWIGPVSRLSGRLNCLDGIRLLA